MKVGVLVLLYTIDCHCLVQFGQVCIAPQPKMKHSWVLWTCVCFIWTSFYKLCCNNTSFIKLRVFFSPLWQGHCGFQTVHRDSQVQSLHGLQAHVSTIVCPASCSVSNHNRLFVVAGSKHWRMLFSPESCDPFSGLLLACFSSCFISTRSNKEAI